MSITNKSEIPKVIHQTWISDSFDETPLVGRCYQSVGEMNPDWHHRFYSDEDMEESIESSGHLGIESFRKLPGGAEKADVFRCSVLLENGGIYCDIDMEAIRPFDELLERALREGILTDDTEVLFTTDHPIHCARMFSGQTVYKNHFMVAKPGARIFALYLSEIARMMGQGDMQPENPVSTTGALFLTGLIERFGGTQALGIGVIPSEWVSPLPDMALGFPEIKPYRKAILDGSWRRRFNPFMAHYWWHSYTGRPCIFSIFGDKIFEVPKEVDATGCPILAPIPKIIWQTAVSLDLIPPQGLECMKSWAEMNPGWEIRFADDADIRALFVEHFPQYLKLFDQLPLGVMKADLWRYAILHLSGGVYADIDSICTVPLDSWINPLGDTRLHASWEDSHPFICQWAFAAPPGHPLLLDTLDTISARVEEDDGVNPERKHYVHYYTGPGVWTDVIREFEKNHTSPLIPKEMRDSWIADCLIVYPEGSFTFGPIRHECASHNWRGGAYVSWRDARNSLAEKSNSSKLSLSAE